MITRLEIDGFKSLRGFALDLGPFTVLVGPNSAGKSNILEALALLSRLTSGPIEAAFKQGRGRAIDQFTLQKGEPVRAIRLAAELLLPVDVRVEGTATNRLRYELTIARERRGSGTETLVVEDERLATIAEAQDLWVARYPALAGRAHHAPPMDILRQVERTRKDLRKTQRRLQVTEEDGYFQIGTEAYTALAAVRAGLDEYEIAIPLEDAQPVLDLAKQQQISHRHAFGAVFAAGIRQMGAGRAGGRQSPPAPMPAPAAAQTLGALRLLHLDSARLHEESERIGGATLAPDASNLPTVLAALPPHVLGEIRADLVVLVPGISTFEVVADKDSFRIDFELSGGDRLPARLVSDGTLRALALLTALRSRPAASTIAIEEPENGIYPGRLRALLDLVREAADRPGSSAPPEGVAGSADEDDEEPDSIAASPQILLTSHSPVVLAAMRDDPGCLRFIDMVRRNGHLSTRARGVGAPGSGERGTVVSLREIDALLSVATTEAAE